MYLRRLQIHGFKSFAASTTLEFQRGVTAVVGPNGSGKSNVSDAIRWVLGEQNSRLIRARKSDDVIFAGSSTRTPLGFAEATLVLDNAERWLDVDFAEIAITRRVYRSGENEYYVNRSRVRLRDLVELLMKANVGQNAYTVVGQGLIDEALSLRPEDRRILIEEAGDLRRHYARLKETRDKLESTIANLNRVEESVVELSPRVERLEKQARLSLEHRQLSNELSHLLQAWYRVRLAKLQSTASQLEERRHQQEMQLEEERAALEHTEAALASLRERQETLRRELESLRERHSGALRKQDQLAQQEELLKTRSGFLRQQQAELLKEIQWLEATIERETSEIESSRGRLRALEERVELETSAAKGQRDRLSDLDAEARQLRETTGVRQRNLEAKKSRCEAVRRSMAAADNEERAAAQASERASMAQDMYLKQVETYQGKLSQLDEECRALQTQVDGLVQQIAEARERSAGAQKRVADTETKLGETNRSIHSLRARLDAIESLQSSGSGLFSGVRVVLTAAKSGIDVQRAGRAGDRGSAGPPSAPGAMSRLEGIVGLVGDLVQVPRELELAIETVLVQRVQDIVVERWEHAEAAIALLKRLGAGRATFLPLDTIKTGRAYSPPAGDGVIGCAAQLVKFDPRFSRVVDMLLGQVIVVTDLPSAHRLVRGGLPGGQIVTLEGEIVRPSGSVTGGAPVQKSNTGYLARQREVRELRLQLAKAESEVSSLKTLLEQEQRSLHSLRQDLTTLEQRRQELELQQRVRQIDLERVRRELQSSANEIEKLRASIRSADSSCEARQASRTRLVAELQELEQAVVEEQDGIGQLQTRRTQIQTEMEFESQRVKEQKERREQTRAALEREASVLSDREANHERLGAQLRAKRARVQEHVEEEQGVQDQLTAVATQRRASLAQTEEAASALATLADAIAQLSGEESALREREKVRRLRLGEEENRLTQTAIDHERCLARLGQLIQSAEEEGVTIDRGALSGASHAQAQPLLRQGAVGSAVGAANVGLLSDGTDPLSLDADVLRRRVDRLRVQIKSIEPVNPLAPEEYAEAKEKLDFLTTHSADLRAASKPLQTAIDQLEQLIQEQFMATFQALDTQFREYFTLLFGGGSARLVLTAPDDPSQTGLEIVAQPPGKRKQSLSLLSGGERALSGAALLFALTRLRPVPFCVLDEVDAALDEANVGRFCQLIGQLTSQTQFIVITHNRATMEMADTLFGVTMGQDGVSRLVSMKMDKR